MCKKSRVGKNTAKTDAKCDTHRKQQEKQKTQVAFAWTSSPPPPHPPPPHRAERQMQVEAGMCGKSRVGKNTVKTDAKCDAHRKTPNKKMRNAELNMFLHGCSRLAHFFAINHRKTDAKAKAKFNSGRRKCQNLSFSTCQHRNRTTPRGGRRNGCQQQQQQQSTNNNSNNSNCSSCCSCGSGTGSSRRRSSSSSTTTTTTTTTTAVPLLLLLVLLLLKQNHRNEQATDAVHQQHDTNAQEGNISSCARCSCYCSYESNCWMLKSDNKGGTRMRGNNCCELTGLQLQVSYLVASVHHPSELWIYKLLHYT